MSGPIPGTLAIMISDNAEPVEGGTLVKNTTEHTVRFDNGSLAIQVAPGESGGISPLPSNDGKPFSCAVVGLRWKRIRTPFGSFRMKLPRTYDEFIFSPGDAVGGLELSEDGSLE